jgi:hypothetical protein
MNVELPEASQAVYLERLQKLTPEQIAIATEMVIEEWDRPSQMPPLAFILARIGGDTKLQAEQAWEMAWKLVKHDWYADGIGWVNDAARKLTPAIQYAIRQCGGEYRMAYSTEEDFPFIRRDFLQAYERFAVEGGEQVRLMQGEAVKMLDRIRKGELPE